MVPFLEKEKIYIFTIAAIATTFPTQTFQLPTPVQKENNSKLVKMVIICLVEQPKDATSGYWSMKSLKLTTSDDRSINHGFYLY